ncbi:hypothetical protein DPEC_G00026800 [Dallia pectoralis]|uniref:Uncharacterized protein n=1 Tax=Dallia pectoralis TaxID=75939 RepID=A0ACC2HI46_DALPE|nr:hypothetical protein DPEC_G00026800 [Dallia pectoralis]
MQAGLKALVLHHPFCTADSAVGELPDHLAANCGEQRRQKPLPTPLHALIAPREAEAKKPVCPGCVTGRGLVLARRSTYFPGRMFVWLFLAQRAGLGPSQFGGCQSIGSGCDVEMFLF